MRTSAFLRVIFVVVLTASSWGLGIAGNANAKTPWVVHYAGKNPDLDGRMLRVERFSLKKDAAPQMEYRLLLPIVRAFADGQKKQAENNALSAAWSQFNEVFAIAGAASTFAEHAMFIKGLAGINGHFTNIGTALGLFQVVLDITADDHSAALIDSYKTAQGYWLGTIGTAGMQIGGVAAFVVDYWLTDIRKTTWLNHKNKLRKAYAAYYKDKTNPGYRDINAWKIIIYRIYQKSKKSSIKNKTKAQQKQIRQAYFSNRLHREIDAYIARFWDDDFRGVDLSDSKHLMQFHRTSKADKAALQAEFKAKLMQQFTKRIFPELGQRAWREWAERELRTNINSSSRFSLVSELNKVLLLEIRAYGLKQPAKLVIHRNGGKPWQGAIRPGRRVGVKMTKIAFIRAGAPQKVSMIVDGKTATETFQFDKNGKAVVSFGVPEVLAVTTYARQESAQTCQVKKISRDKKPERFTETRKSAGGPIHMTASVSGETIIGRYSLEQNKWLEYSVGKATSLKVDAKNFNATDIASAMKVDYSVRFFPPYFDDIVTLEKCTGQTTVMGRSELACTVRRYKRNQVSKNTLIERNCRSSITLKSKNMFMTAGNMKGQIVDFESKKIKQSEREFSKGARELQDLLKNLPKP